MPCVGTGTLEELNSGENLYRLVTCMLHVLLAVIVHLHLLKSLWHHVCTRPRSCFPGKGSTNSLACPRMRSDPAVLDRTGFDRYQT